MSDTPKTPTAWEQELRERVDELIAEHHAVKRREKGSRRRYRRSRWSFVNRYGARGAGPVFRHEILRRVEDGAL